MAEPSQEDEVVPSDCILELFKMKVEEAVNLVRHISSENQVEAWQFWEDVSKTVKTVTGADSVAVRPNSGENDDQTGIGSSPGKKKIGIAALSSHSYKLTDPKSSQSAAVVHSDEIFTTETITVRTDKGTNVYESQLPQKQTQAKRTKSRGRPRRGKKAPEALNNEAAATDLDNLENSVAEAAKHVDTMTFRSPWKCNVCGRKINRTVNTRAGVKTKVLDENSCRGCGKKYTARYRTRRQTAGKTDDSVKDLEDHKSQVHSEEAAPFSEDEFADDGLEDVEGEDPEWTGERTSPRRGGRRKRASDSDTERESPKKRSGTGKRDCDECGAKLCSEASLEVHMRKHSGEKPFPCQQCGRSFTTKCNMQRHERTHSGAKPYKCPECNKWFTEKKSVKVHMRSHTGEKPYKCTICDRSFAQTGILQSHMHLHTGHKGHLCDFCGKAFRQKSQMRIHQKRHFNNRTYKCDLCESTFISKGDMDRHRLKHTGERPFLCTQCPKSFTRMQYLKEHMNQHTGVKPYKCKECNASFHEMSTYHRHVRKHKTEEAKQNGKDQRVTLVFKQDGSEDTSKTDITTLLLSAGQVDQVSQLNELGQIVHVSEHGSIPLSEGIVTQASNGEVYHVSYVDQSMLAAVESGEKLATSESEEVSAAVSNVTLLLKGSGEEACTKSDVATLLLSAEELERLESLSRSRVANVTESPSSQSQEDLLTSDTQIHVHDLNQIKVTEFSQLPASIRDSGIVSATANGQTYHVTYLDSNTLRQTHSVITTEDLTAMNLLASATTHQF